MPAVITTCEKCRSQYSWNTDYQDMPDCPRCGYNQRHQYQRSDISGLLNMLKTNDQYASCNAAVELGNRGDLNAVEPLITALRHPSAKPAAIISLGKLGDERAVTPLIEILKEREGEGAFGCAAEALVRIGSPRGIQAVVDGIVAADMRYEQGRRMKEVFAAFLAIGPSVVQFIAPLLDKHGHEYDRWIRQYTSSVLKQVGWIPSDETQKIVFFVNTDQWDKLKDMGQVAVTILVVAFAGIGDEDLVKYAPTALDKLGWTPSTEEEVKAYLRGHGQEGALIRAGSKAVKPLLEALQDNDEKIRNTASKALCGIADPTGLFPVILSEVDKEQKSIAANILCKAATPDTFDNLVSALSNKDYGIRCIAARALGNLGDRRAVPILMRIVSRKEEFRPVSQAIEALGELRDNRAVETLIAALSDETLSVSLIAKSLAEIGDSRAIAPLKAIARKKKRYNNDPKGAISAAHKIMESLPNGMNKWWRFW